MTGVNVSLPPNASDQLVYKATMSGSAPAGISVPSFNSPRMSLTHDGALGTLMPVGTDCGSKNAGDRKILRCRDTINRHNCAHKFGE